MEFQNHVIYGRDFSNNLSNLLIECCISLHSTKFLTFLSFFLLFSCFLQARCTEYIMFGTRVRQFIQRFGQNSPHQPISSRALKWSANIAFASLLTTSFLFGLPPIPLNNLYVSKAETPSDKSQLDLACM